MQIVSDEEIREKWHEVVHATDTRKHGSGGAALALVRWVEARLLEGHGDKNISANLDHIFSVSSGYGWNTRRAFVALELDGAMLAQVPPEGARALAYNLLSGAESAEQDAFLFEFTEKELGGSLEMGAQILTAYRAWREGK